MATRSASTVASRLRAEGGFLIIEVLVSAMLLVTISLTVMLALDRADGLAGDQQERTVAANVAQAELERVRSLPIEDIANLRSTKTLVTSQSLNGITYTITTATKWLSDGRDSVDCTQSNGGLDYIQATTSVSWKGENSKPVKMSTLISPSNRSTSSDHGSLSIQVVDAAGNGVANLPVTLDGDDSYSDSTDQNGCVAWGDLTATAPWELKFARAGYVDQDGNNAVDDTITLAGGATTTRQYLYDVGGQMALTFRSRLASNGTNDIQVLPTAFIVANSSMTSDRKFTPPIPGSPKPWDDGTLFFPFNSSAYSVYAGTCSSNKISPGYNSGDGVVQAPTNVNTSPGQKQGASVWLPALKITVTGNSGLGGTVVVTDDCGTRYTRTLTGSGTLLNTYDEAFPYFKNGKVCVQLTNGKATTRTAIANTNYAGETAIAVTMGTTTGVC